MYDYEQEDQLKFNRKLFAILLIVGIAASVSGMFIYHGYRVTPTRYDNVSTQGEWVRSDDRYVLYNFACPNSGELVSSVWKDSSYGAWKVRTDSAKDHWDRLEADFKDEEHAKAAAERFINKNNVCDKR